MNLQISSKMDEFSDVYFELNSTIMLIQTNSVYLCDQSSFSVIGFKFYRFCKFYRITRELKNRVAKPSELIPLFALCSYALGFYGFF